MNKQIKVLLVDDEVSLRETYADILRANGFNVAQAGDGVEGLDVATKEVPDIIFTGIIMPRMDGFALMEALKKNVATVNIPVVISSHMGREEDRQRAIELGAKDFIIKNMTPPNEVVRRVQAILETHGIYDLFIDPYSLDAQRMASELSLNGYKCPRCSRKLSLELKTLNSKEKTFQARFICPGCGGTIK